MTGWNVAHVTPRYPPLLGGVEAVVQQLARRQVARGHTVRVYTAALGSSPSGVTDEAGVEVHRLRARSLGNTPIIPGLTRELLDPARAPDLVHVHGTHTGVAEQVTGACVPRRVPYLAHLHLLVRPSSLPGRLLLRPYLKLVYARHLRGAARVVCLTRSMAGDVIRSYGVDPSRVEVVPNGAPDVRPDDPGRRHPDRLLFAGRLTAQKNIVPLVAAMARLPELELFVIGDGDQAGEVRQTISRLGLRNVRLLGRQPPEVVAAAYQEAAALVLPSSHEGLPLVLLEAMAAGLPVVASAIPEIVEAAGDAFFPIDRPVPAEIADAIRRCVGSLPVLARLSRAGRDVAARHSWDRTVQLVSGVYRSVLETKEDCRAD